MYTVFTIPKWQFDLHILSVVLFIMPFHSRTQTCEYGIKCPKAHSVEELQEWMMRAAEEKIRHNTEAQGPMSYNERLLEEYKNSSNEVHIVSTRL